MQPDLFEGTAGIKLFDNKKAYNANICVFNCQSICPGYNAVIGRQCSSVKKDKNAKCSVYQSHSLLVYN